MTREEAKIALEKIYKVSTDNHNIHTPLSLCEEMINLLNYSNGTLLVISNLEFLIILKEQNKDLSNVHYTTSCDIKKQVAIKLGININNIHNLEYNNKEINFGTPENMKFDYIIANPPYKKGLHLMFLEKSLKIKNSNGEIVFLHPAEWLVQKRKTIRNKHFDFLKTYITGANITFIDNQWDNVGLWVPLSITHINNTKEYYFNDLRHIFFQKTIKIDSLNDIFQFGISNYLYSFYNKIYNYSKENNWSKIEKLKEHKKYYIHLHKFTGVNSNFIKKYGNIDTFYDNKIRNIYLVFTMIDGELSKNIYMINHKLLKPEMKEPGFHLII